MNHLQLDERLRGLDAVERIQLRTRENVRDFDGGELADEPDGIPRMQGKYFSETIRCPYTSITDSPSCPSIITILSN